MAAHAKTAPISSLVAVYWRVEEEVDRPVAGSTFMLEVMITAAGERGEVQDQKQINEKVPHQRHLQPVKVCSGSAR